MKKLNKQSKVVIMCGISGSGKTHYARGLEKDGYVRLSTDVLIWDKVGSGLFSLLKEEQRRLFAESRKQVKKQLENCLETGQKVVVDATHCKRSGRDEIRNLCARMGVEPLFVYCYADKEKLWSRLSLRKGAGPDDLLVSKEEFSEYWLGFERPEDDETDFIFL